MRCHTRLRLDRLEDRAAPAVFTVTSLSDSGPGSLRDAIAQANDENTNPGSDTIRFAAAVRGGTVNLTTFTNLPDGTTDPAVPQPVGPTALIVSSSVVIEGTGEMLTRTGAAEFRLFQVTATGDLTLENLTLTYGLARGGDGGNRGGGAAGLGGAVYNQGVLDIFGCTLTGNAAVGGANFGGLGGGGGGLGGPGDAAGGGGPPDLGGAGGGSGGFGGGGGLGQVDTPGGSGGFGGGGGGDSTLANAGNGGFGGGGGGGGLGNGFGGFGGGDGVFAYGGAGAGMGGAVFNQGGSVTVGDSTLAGNTARGGDATGSSAHAGSGFGGAISNLNGLVTLTNVTITGNTAAAGTGPVAGSATGGGVMSLGLNVVSYPGGPSATAPGQIAVLRTGNSILALNHGGPDLESEVRTEPSFVIATGPDIVSSFFSSVSPSGPPFISNDPLLGPLQNNGGLTPTMALLPAINAGVFDVLTPANLGGGPPFTDQHGLGFDRIWNARVDIGAYETEDRTPTLTVTNLNDAGPGSLREAVALANDETDTGHPGADVIAFAPGLRGGTVGLTTFENPSAGTADNPEPVGPTALIVSSTVVIDGTGETLTRTGAGEFRLFQVTTGGDLTLEGLTLSNGLARGGAGLRGGGAAGLGGAVYNQGRLDLLGCTLVGNAAVGGANVGGSIFSGGGGLGGPGDANGNGGTPNGGLANPTGFGGAGGFGGGGGYGLRVGGPGGFGGGGGDGSMGGGDGGFGGGGAVGSGLAGFGGGGGNGGGSAGAGAGLGGAVFNEFGTVSIRISTIAGNTAKGGDATGTGGGAGSGFGGGVYNLNGTVLLTNVTIAGNTVAPGSSSGGAIAGQAAGGAVYNEAIDLDLLTPTTDASVTLANSILANSVGGDDVHNVQYLGTATITATGPNLASAAVGNDGGTVSGTVFTVADPRLGALTYNGGPTRTMVPLAGSPALDAGSIAAVNDLTTDQRGEGFLRVVNGACPESCVRGGGWVFAQPVPLTEIPAWTRP